jgi:hypothetical protein
MVIVLLLVSAASFASCTDKNKEQSTPLTKRERDSVIGESSLPGAAGVRGALRAADSAEARNRRAAEIN